MAPAMKHTSKALVSNNFLEAVERVLVHEFADERAASLILHARLHLQCIN